MQLHGIGACHLALGDIHFLIKKKVSLNCETLVLNDACFFPLTEIECAHQNTENLLRVFSSQVHDPSNLLMTG